MIDTWENEAGWIWIPDWNPEDDNKVGGLAYFRRTFNIGELPCRAVVKASADSRYRLFINGVSVSFGPCKGDKHTWYYESIDISMHLKTGTNILAAVVLRNPFSQPEKGNATVWRTNLPGLFIHGEVKNNRGDVIEKLHTDALWKCMKDRAVVFDQGNYMSFLGIVENVEGSKLPFGWTLPDFEDSGWLPASQHRINTANGGLSPWQLTERPIPLMKEEPARFVGAKRVLDSIVAETAWNNLLKLDQPLEIPANSRIIAEIDAGELTSGFLMLALSSGERATVRMLCAECYENEPLFVPWFRSKGDRTDSVNCSLYGDYDMYKVAGISSDSGLSEIYEPFWFRTFRYIRLEIETSDKPLVINSFIYRETGYPLDITGVFNSSEDSYSALWDISLRTLKDACTKAMKTARIMSNCSMRWIRGRKYCSHITSRGMTGLPEKLSMISTVQYFRKA